MESRTQEEKKIEDTESAEDIVDKLKCLMELHSSAKKQVFFIVPFSMPGSGKWLFLNTIQTLAGELNWSFASLSSDTIRNNLMQPLLRKGIHKSVAFNQTHKPAQKEYTAELERLVEQSAQGKEQVRVIYCEKNHPPNSIAEFVKKVSGIPSATIDFRILYLIPEATTPIPNYPLSFSNLLTSYYRMMSRDEHETLDNSDPVQAAKVLFKFARLNYKWALNEEFIRETGIDGFLPVSLTERELGNIVDEDLERMIEEVLADKSESISKLKKFIALADQYRPHFVYEVNQSSITKAMNNCNNQNNVNAYSLLGQTPDGLLQILMYLQKKH